MKIEKIRYEKEFKIIEKWELKQEEVFKHIDGKFRMERRINKIILLKISIIESIYNAIQQECLRDGFQGFAEEIDGNISKLLGTDIDNFVKNIWESIEVIENVEKRKNRGRRELMDAFRKSLNKKK